MFFRKVFAIVFHAVYDSFGKEDREKKESERKRLSRSGEGKRSNAYLFRNL